MTKKKPASKKDGRRDKIKDLKLNKDTVENLSDKSEQVRGGGVSNTACVGQICGPTQACPSTGCIRPPPSFACVIHG